MFDNYQFDLINEFAGYNSAQDKTNIRSNFLVRGSQNVYKTMRGTIANRCGLKRRGTSDSTDAGIVSSFEWQSTGSQRTYPLRIQDNKLQFESDLNDGSALVWYDLLETLTLQNPALTLTRFSYAPWYEYQESKDRLLMVRGDENILHWSGGFTKVSGGTLAGGSGAIATYDNTGNAGGDYAVGDYIFIGTGNEGAVAQVATISGGGATGPVATLTAFLASGHGYTAATTYSTTTSGIGEGFTLHVLTVTTTSTLTKSDSSRSWSQDGFASKYPWEKKLIINGVEYSYSGGEDTDTIYGVSPDPSAITSSLAIQSVIVDDSDRLSTSVSPVAFEENDMIRVMDGQSFVGSYSSQVLRISAGTTNRFLGFLDYINIGSLIKGDPDIVALDSPLTAMFPKDGKLYVSGGTSDWYIVSPNTPISAALTPAGTNAYIFTKTEKIPGYGLAAAVSNEFIDGFSGDIIFLAQDNQVRVFSTSTANVFTKKFPILSYTVFSDFDDEDFTGGHLKTVGKFVYITAPNSGRHYMYETRENYDQNGNVVGEKMWHPPQVSGISRFADIDGVTYGHSSQNPQIYQIWDTNQWYDDSPTDAQISYTSIIRMAYGHLREKNGYDFVGTGKFDKFYVEGYLDLGSLIYGNVYLDYQGASGTQPVIINTIDSPATFYNGDQPTGIGMDTIGLNPLGDGLVNESDNFSLLTKFRAICDLNPIDNFEYQLEIYSVDAGTRFELLRLGVNIISGESQPVEIRKAS